MIEFKSQKVTVELGDSATVYEVFDKFMEFMVASGYDKSYVDDAACKYVVDYDKNFEDTHFGG